MYKPYVTTKTSILFQITYGSDRDIKIFLLLLMLSALVWA